LPNLELACDLDVAAAHMSITQVIGLPVGKSSLQALKSGNRTDDEERRVGNKRQRLVNTVRHLVQGRRGLVITYKNIEHDFRSIDGVEVAHFNAIEGIDRWKEVEVLVIIGRPLPSSRDIEAMAAAITGQPVVAEKMVKLDREIRPGHVLECRIYAVPEAEMIRQAVTEAAIEQAVGRARGVNRTAANPVEVLMVLDDTVVPGLDVDGLIGFRDMEPDTIDQMFARGLVPAFPTDAARLYPDLFPTRAAAKKAYQRDRLRTGRGPRGPRLGTRPYKDISIRRCPQPPRDAFCFQPTGRGQLLRFCIADLVKVPDVRAMLEAAFGRLVRFEKVGRAKEE
jgi:putative DNA primase/helicase